MSIECYDITCKFHPRDEPFCNEEECIITTIRTFLTTNHEFAFALSCAAVCGLNTVTEAIMNYELHGIQMMPNDQVQQRMSSLYDSELLWIASGYGEYIPEWFIKEENEKMEQYFVEVREPDDAMPLL
jgi:hypothetical protein